MGKIKLWYCGLVSSWEAPSASVFWISCSPLNSGNLWGDCGCVHYLRLGYGT